MVNDPKRPVGGQPIDPRTNRPLGDHGSAVQAIEYALEHVGDCEAVDFLRAWREGDLDEWPEFYPWLAGQPNG